MKDWLVDDVMTTDVVTVREDTSYREIVDLLAEKRISGVPVVDGFSRILGVVSEADLLHKVEMTEDAPPRVFEGRHQRRARVKAAGTTAADLMSAPARTVLRGTALAAAARKMEASNVKRLPVDDELGRLIGIVTRADLLKVFLRSDTEIRDEVVHDVLRRPLVADERSVSAEVRAGVVTLSGRIERRSAAALLVRLVRKVPGVVDVVDQVTFEFDDERQDAGLPFGVA